MYGMVDVYFCYGLGVVVFRDLDGYGVYGLNNEKGFVGLFIVWLVDLFCMCFINSVMLIF